MPFYTAGRVGGHRRRRRPTSRRSAPTAARLRSRRAARCERRTGTLVTARERVQRARASAERTDAWVGDVRARVDAGFLPPNDLLSAQAQRARADRFSSFRRRTPRRWRRLNSARLVGRRAGAVDLRRSRPSTSRDAGAADVGGQPVGRAGRARRWPAGRSVRGCASAGVARVPAADARRWPAGSRRSAAGAGVEPARPNSRFVPAPTSGRRRGTSASTSCWSLFDGGKARANHAAAAGALGGHRPPHRRIRRSSSPWRSASGCSTSSRAARRSRRRSKPSTATAEARRVVQERFNAGVATSTDVLDAQVALLEAELERTRLAASLRLGEARLLRAVGGRVMLADTAIQVEHLSRRFGSFRRRRRRELRRAARRGLRVSRQQRRRQVHDDSHAVRPAHAHVRPGGDRRHRRRDAIRRASSGASATCRSGSRSTSCSPSTRTSASTAGSTV